MIKYNKKSMTLHIKLGKYDKFLRCPFATWWKARKYFRRPRFKFYFGPMCKFTGEYYYSKQGKHKNYIERGYWPMASTKYLEWYTPKWFPIHVMSSDIGWKDKWSTPRYERPGYFIIFFGRNYRTCWQFSLVVDAPKIYCANNCNLEDYPDNYWESILWYLHYHDNYNEGNGPNLISARESLRGTHMVRYESVPISDYEILNQGFEDLSLGIDENYKFYYLDIKSDKLFNIIDKQRFSLNKLNGLLSNIDVYIRVIIEKRKEGELKKPDSEIHVATQYIKIQNSKDNTEDFDFIRLYFENKDGKLANALNTSYESIEFSFSERIDLGPSFKDEFLNERGIDWVKGYYSNSWNKDNTLI